MTKWTLFESSFAIKRLICLNCFGWTVLHVLHSRSLYPVYTSHHFKPAHPYNYRHSVIYVHVPVYSIYSTRQVQGTCIRQTRLSSRVNEFVSLYKPI